MSYAVNENSAVYYTHTYWNDLDSVRREINRRVSGDPERTWSHRFAELTGGRTFKRALVLNCGNGHVERGLFDEGLIEEWIGIDYSEDLLAEARAAAEGRPGTYHRMDVNTAAFPDEEFDLVVNHAAAHHIARIDTVFRALCDRLPEDGWFVSYDYVGAHRNQYPYDIWNAAHQLNATLPEHLRQDMRYPHLPTMLASDPTEAIHSELILETFGRYFTTEELHPSGGALAYLLITHNTALLGADPAERDPVVDRIMEADAAYLEAHPASTLFAYFAGRPRKDVLERRADLARWRAEEDEREDRALVGGGEYYPHTALQSLELRIEEQRWTIEHLRHLEELRQQFPFPQWERLRTSRTADRIRSDPRLGRVARAVMRRARGLSRG